MKLRMLFSIFSFLLMTSLLKKMTTVLSFAEPTLAQYSFQQMQFQNATCFSKVDPKETEKETKNGW